MIGGAKMKKIYNSDKTLEIVFVILISVYCLLALIPFWLVIINSLSDETIFLREGYQLLPRKFSLGAYKMILYTNTVFNAYKVTLFITVVGTSLSLVMSSMMAYGLSSRMVKYRNKIAFFVFFTMLFNGGLVPFYILVTTYLRLTDSLWSLILPVLINPWNMFLLRNFFKTIPESIPESARIDGANEIYIMFRIILPLSLPALATIGLFYALAYWNEWFRAFLFIYDRKKFPLQYLIMEMLSNIRGAIQDGNQIQINSVVPAYTSRLATSVVTIGPIIFLYPFLQKYFVKGLTVGSVKG